MTGRRPSVLRDLPATAPAPGGRRPAPQSPPASRAGSSPRGPSRRLRVPRLGGRPVILDEHLDGAVQVRLHRVEVARLKRVDHVVTLGHLDHLLVAGLEVLDGHPEPVGHSGPPSGPNSPAGVSGTGSGSTGMPCSRMNAFIAIIWIICVTICCSSASPVATRGCIARTTLYFSPVSSAPPWPMRVTSHPSLRMRKVSAVRMSTHALEPSSTS